MQFVGHELQELFAPALQIWNVSAESTEHPAQLGQSCSISTPKHVEDTANCPLQGNRKSLQQPPPLNMLENRRPKQAAALHRAVFSVFCKSFVINRLNAGEIALCHLI